MALEDEKIIELYWERSENAIAETDKKYRERCLYVARSILNDNSDAEECLNDTYLTAWNLIPPEKPEILSAFLFRIIRNHSLNRLRTLNRDKRKRDLTFSLDELGECMDSRSVTEENFDETEVLNAINDFLRTLNKDNRFILVRRYWFFDSIADISKRSSMTEENVRARLSRLRKRLKKYLKKKVGL